MMILWIWWITRRQYLRNSHTTSCSLLVILTLVQVIDTVADTTEAILLHFGAAIS